MKKKYKKSVSREGSLIGFQAWNEGDTQELKKRLGWSFKRLYFVNKNGLIDSYYDVKEGDYFYDKLKEKLSGRDFFDKLISDFMDKVNEGKEIMKKELLSKEDIFSLYDTIVMCWPATTIFDQISTDPEITNNKQEILNKLEGIRKQNSKFMYDAESKLLRSITKNFPEIGGFEDVVRIEELFAEKFPSKEILERRKQQYILYDDTVEINISFIDLSEEHNFEIVKDSIVDDKKIKGVVAMTGTALGRVKVVFKIEDIGKVEQGDVLVAPMTTPEYIIAMEKAVAFITDEGGITCHAAIIAREFRKPCIVGTKHATKLLKDNDLVFVDANKGIVEKIE